MSFRNFREAFVIIRDENNNIAPADSGEGFLSGRDLNASWAVI